MKASVDILILTATFGSGHISVAQAIKDHIGTIESNLNVEIVDMFQLMNPKIYKSMYKGYEVLISRNSRLYNHFYYKKNYSEYSQVDDIIYNLYLPKISSYISSIDPRVIISTFPVCSGFISKYKEKYHSTIPLVTCITDVVDSWEWIHPNTNMYFVANNETKKKLIKKGISKQIICPTGIPVRAQFFNRQENSWLLNAFNISDEDFVVLMMGGGMGILPEEKEFYIWLNELKDTKTMILTGKNVELYNALKEYSDLENIIPIEYTDNVAEYMKISNLLVSKSGGVTLFEAITSHLPMIVFNPSLGQEIENAKFIVDKGLGSIAYNIYELKKEINRVLYDKNYRNRLYLSAINLSKHVDMKMLSKAILDLYYSNRRQNYFMPEEKEYLKIN
ncbi:MGDG synthase family glycosyltransferase [Brassicibacter mesophilus]|uniref:MGDG synthase family glycosyltransferase n=1 Tax=Brassicibacter mesophilus TaxID=745119 RepID=UPI003D21841F